MTKISTTESSETHHKTAREELPRLGSVLPLVTITAYVAATILGLFISSARFSRLGINYLYFASITDIIFLPLVYFGWTLLIFTASALAMLVIYERTKISIGRLTNSAQISGKPVRPLKRLAEATIGTTLAAASLLTLLAWVAMISDVNSIKMEKARE